MKIGFIGLGHMGSGMARNLLRAGHEVVVFNRSREKAEVLVADGARVADTPAGVCSVSEAIMTMLADDRAVEQVVFGENAIASALPVGAIHISCSTISIALAKRLAAEHRRRGQRYLSVPVFGRPEAAESKNLLVVAAGPPEVVEQCRPLYKQWTPRCSPRFSDPPYSLPAGSHYNSFEVFGKPENQHPGMLD